MLLPYATFDLPGTGGLSKATPEDFEVEELPAYEPCGQGEHLFVWIEKRGLTTEEAAAALAAHFGVPVGEVGYAGQKDRQAITRQYLSVPARAQAKAEGFSHQKMRLLSWARHGNKLKIGHTRGNRFRVRLRGVAESAAALAVIERLRRDGLPNYFGDQRFGRRQDNADRGRLLLLGEPAGRVGRYERRMLLSALQSRLFNRTLALRLQAGTLGKALLGDVLKKHDSGGEFLCTAPEVDQPRVDSFLVSPAGPLFGPRMLLSSGGVAEAEALVLQEEGLSPADFDRGGKLTQGVRRHYRVPLAELSAQVEGDELVLSFCLPPGSYATVLLREVQKPDESL